MLEIFLKTLPFFLLIGTGWLAGRVGLFPQEATAWLTKFVFYFALSAMLFRFAATVDIDRLFDPAFVLAYLCGTLALWVVAMAVGRWRRLPLSEAGMEAHSAITGNTGFLGVPMLVVLLGQQAIGPVLMVLTIDLVLFSTVITLIVTGARQGRITAATILPLARGIAANPMIVSMVAGLVWARLHLPMPAPLDEFLSLLGGAATPGALFAIGASLAGRSAERLGPALWLSGAKLFLHPLAVGVAALALFHVDPFAAGVMIAAASLPVAGNVYILAQHFGVAPHRVSTAILISTAASIATVPVVIHWITKG
ncbi:AEC family transporter [Paracoccus sp. KR1-242]|uniref:AEC family transporter n=1 Tax=Paracoccus sp. KR1-242 TaxID=3410028 RepID=UPI003C10A913